MLDNAGTGADMPWLEPFKQRIWSTFPSHQPRHAWLVSGAREDGRKELVLGIARRLLCHQGAAACGRCTGCLLFAAGAHPDFILVERREGSQLLSVQAVREAIDTLSQTAHQNSWRVVLIEDADYLSLGAANALLKTLEEPPPRTVLFLLVSRESHVPATIRSRCVRIHVRLPERRELYDWLVGQGFAEQEVEKAIDVCNGVPLQIRSFIDQKGVEKWQQWYDSLIRYQRCRASTAETTRQWLQLDKDCLVWLACLLHRHIFFHQRERQCCRFHHRLFQQVLQALGDWDGSLNKSFIVAGVLDGLKRDPITPAPVVWST